MESRQKEDHKKNSELSSLDLLPADMQKLVFFLCDRRTQVALASTSKSWYQKSKKWEDEFNFTIAALQQRISTHGYFIIQVEEGNPNSGVQCKKFSQENIHYCDEYFVVLYLGEFRNSDPSWFSGLISLSRNEFKNVGKHKDRMITFSSYRSYQKKMTEGTVIGSIEMSTRNRNAQINAAKSLRKIFGIKKIFNKFSEPSDHDYDIEKNVFMKWFFKLASAQVNELESRNLCIEILGKIKQLNLIAFTQANPNDVLKIQILQEQDFEERCVQIVSEYLVKCEAEADSQVDKRQKIK